MRTTLRLAATAALGLTLTACATGDGRELRPPTVPAPTTTEPPHIDPPVEFPSDVDETLPGELPEPGPDDVPVDPPDPFGLFAAWTDGAPIDARYTCDGADVSPALTWTGVPDGTIELAITAVVDDPGDGMLDDAPVRWIVTGIDPSIVSVVEGILPPGAMELPNDLGLTGWSGPCPAEGTSQVLRITVHALGQQIEGLGADTPATAVELLRGVALANAEVRGVVTR